MECRHDDVEEAIIRQYTRGIARDDREDVQQTIRLRWWKLRAKRADAGMGLLVTVSRYAVADFLRSRRRMRTLSRSSKGDGSRTAQPLDLIASQVPPPHARADARDLIRHALRQLTPRERRIVSALVTKRTLGEAALQIGISYTAMSVAVSRMRKKARSECRGSGG